TQLTETAHDRLTTLAAHTELGAGMQVAMKDLEIRGAGNLLGGQQSGHIEGVGFDLYVRLVGEAVAKFRGEDTEPEADMRIELPVDAHLPAEYVAHERLRLEAYRKLAAAADEAELQEVLDELVDRYGPYPESVTVLADVADCASVPVPRASTTSSCRAISSASARSSSPTPRSSGSNASTRSRCSNRRCGPCSCPSRWREPGSMPR